MGEVDDTAEAEDDGQAERQEDVVGAHHKAVQDLLDDDEEHGMQAASGFPGADRLTGCMVEKPGSRSLPTLPGRSEGLRARTSRRSPPWSAGSARENHWARAKLRRSRRCPICPSPCPFP